MVSSRGKLLVALALERMRNETVKEDIGNQRGSLKYKVGNGSRPKLHRPL